jgi:hypothetical protein
MKQRNQTMLKTLGVAMMLVGANAAIAAESVTVPASVTVNNAIDFTFTGALNFGQVRATPDDTDLTCAGLVMPANPAESLEQDTPAICTAGDGDAIIQSVGGTPERPVFTIAGVAPFSNMEITLPTTTSAITANTGPGTAQFTLSEFTAYKTSGTPSDIPLTAGVGEIQANATGTATFTVGATLGTHLGAISTAANAVYQDLTYTGTFIVSVDY